MEEHNYVFDLPWQLKMFQMLRSFWGIKNVETRWNYEILSKTSLILKGKTLRNNPNQVKVISLPLSELID